MSIAHLSVPNFRIPKRLISWMQENCVRERVFSAEKVFFKENIDVKTRAWGLVGYSKLVGRLPAEMEDVIAACPEACVGYASSINRSEVPDKVILACGEHGGFVVKMAAALSRRIPQLESKIITPEQYVSYVSEIRQRVPEMEERILFSGDFPKEVLAIACKDLIERLSGHNYGEMPEDSPANDPRIKDLLKASPDSVCSYMDYLSRRGLRLPEEYHHVFAGRGLYLSKLAEHLRKRLPLELEETWEGAKNELVQYATRWVRGRLSENLERVLIGDQKAAALYAFQVVRGYADPRLSDTLHSFMLMQSYAHPEDQEIKRYIAECDRVEEFRKNYELSGTNG